MEARQEEALRETLERLRAEIADLRASRERVVLAGDAERRRIERDLHRGVQQHLVALAVKLQLAESVVESDPAATRALIQEMAADVQQALDEAARLAGRICAPLIEVGGLGAGLRAAAVSAGVPASVDAAGRTSYPPEVALTVYLAWLEALEQPAAGAKAAITVRGDEQTLTFDLSWSAPGENARLAQLRDRVEALGGRLTVEPAPAAGTRVLGSLPLAR